MKIRLFDMFAGYGGAEFSLKKAGIEYECIGFSEIDKYAIQCFEQNHKGKNFGDCTKINPNELPDFDLLTGGFPCQSFSVAGKGLGELDTRGTLFNEIIRIAEVKKPKMMLLENVKGLTNKPHRATFEKILSELDRIGYVVKWKVLNSKEYGIPQNRERVFFVCFLKGMDTMKFSFPEKEELKIFLKDILEEEVDEKYYLSEKQINKILNSNFMQEKLRIQKGGVCSSILARDWKDPKLIIQKEKLNNPQNKIQWFGREVVFNITKNSGQEQPIPEANRIYDSFGISPSVKNSGVKVLARDEIIQVNNPKHSNNRVYSEEGISPTLRDMSLGGNRQPFILRGRPKMPYEKGKRELNYKIYPDFCPTLSKNCASGDQKNIVMNTITEAFGRGGSSSEHIDMVLKTSLSCGSIRKLTPKECFRLMGFLDDEINLNDLSNTQRYKLAGNGWDINLVSKIFRGMLK